MVAGSSLVSRSGFVSGSGMVFLSISRVLDISDISRVTISNGISHSLGTTIRQQNAVLSVGGISVTRFLLVEIDTVVIIVDGIGVSVVGGFFMVGRGGFIGGGGMVDGSWPVSVVSGGKGQASECNKSLHY